MAASLCLGALACGENDPEPRILQGVTLQSLAPTQLLEGSTLHVIGSNYLPHPWGAMTLRLMTGDARGLVEVPATYVDAQTLAVSAPSSQSSIS